MDSKEHWQRIHRLNSPQELSWYQEKPTMSLRLIEECKTDKQAAIIDIGGGTSSLVDHLLQQAYDNLTVLDISGLALKETKRRLGQIANKVAFFETNVIAFDAPQQYDVWHDRAVFHFLTSNDKRDRYIHVLNKSLKPGGHLILSTFAPGGPAECSGLGVVHYDATNILGVLGDSFYMVHSTSETHVTPARITQPFMWFVLSKSL